MSATSRLVDKLSTLCAKCRRLQSRAFSQPLVVSIMAFSLARTSITNTPTNQVMKRHEIATSIAQQQPAKRRYARIAFAPCPIVYTVDCSRTTRELFYNQTDYRNFSWARRERYKTGSVASVDKRQCSEKRWPS